MSSLPFLHVVAAWVLLMTAFVFFLLPETKGVPVESVPALFARHWVWKKVRAVCE